MMIDCPTDPILSQFLGEEPREDHFHQVADHIDECCDCQSKFASLADCDYTDRWPDLQQATPQDTFTLDSANYRAPSSRLSWRVTLSQKRPLPALPGRTILSILERLSKLARRNPGISTMAALVVLVTLLGMSGVILARFTPDGTCLVSGSGDSTVRIWDAVPPRQRAKQWQPVQKLPPAIGWHNRPYTPPLSYVCIRASKPLKIDGRIDEAAWQTAPWTNSFIDIEGHRKPKPRFKTQVKMLWDDDYFYIAAKLEEPHVWGTLTKHDSVIFHDNDFEVFIDPDGDNHKYLEYEINALGTDWDLYLPKPYKDGGKADNSWEIPGLKKAVHVQGTLNDPRDQDKGWTIEIAFPWKELGKRAGVNVPPKEGEHWRVNFSRVQWKHEIVEGKYRKIKGPREDNWVWSPQWVINMHRPETWGYVQFTKAAPGTTKIKPDPTSHARHVLHHILYAQRAFQKQHNRWARNLAELGLDRLKLPQSMETPQLILTGDNFSLRTRVKWENSGTATLILYHDGRIEKR